MADSIWVDDLVLNFSRGSMILAQHIRHLAAKIFHFTKSITRTRGPFWLLAVKRKPRISDNTDCSMLVAMSLYILLENPGTRSFDHCSSAIVIDRRLVHGSMWVYVCESLLFMM